MDIRFTKHAREKFAILARHGVVVSEEEVTRTVRGPDVIDKKSRDPQIIFQRNRDEHHVLRVICRKEEREHWLSSLFIPDVNRNMNNQKTTIKYDPDADVMSWEIVSASAEIDHANEMGDLVVHFTKNDQPVLVELLNASENARNNKDPMKIMLEKAGSAQSTTRS